MADHKMHPAQVQHSDNDALGRQEVYGSDVTIAMINSSIGIVHKAKIATICCDSCNGSRGRKYFWVLENSYETNYPITFPCPCFPPNCCCPGIDNVRKTYYDRGPWDRQHCCYTLGLLNGDSFFHEGNTRHVCCCIDCCDLYNAYAACYFPTYCGDRVNFVPSERVCYCCSVRANSCNNCGGACGIKSGEPLPCCMFIFARHLLQGEGPKLMASLDKARSEFVQKTGRA